MISPELREVSGIVWDGYYNIPGLVPGEPITLDQRARCIAEKILESLKLDLKQECIEQIVTASYIKSLAPNNDEGYDPVHDSALTIMAEALKNGWTVVIWTIGDTGVTTEDGSELDPTGNCQMLKLKNGKAYERLEKQVPEANMKNLIVNTSAEGKDKEPSFREICVYAEENGFEEMFVADDLIENRIIVEKLQAKFPKLKIHFYHIQKKNDALGNIDAFRDFILPIIMASANDKEKVKKMLVLDLDDVIVDTAALLDRTALLTSRALAKTLGLKNEA